VKEAVVSDSTCLIGLERAGQLELLPALFSAVAIPPEVEREFGVSFPWLQVNGLFDATLARALRMQVDGGEAEAIALAKQLGLRLILDDRRARAVARNLGLPLIGTVGILLRAKQARLVSHIKPIIDELERHEFFIAPELRVEVLRLAGE
jgi:predicted nucleic acid-binding protein